MTFDDLVSIQPELADIKAQARGWQARYDRWETYEHLKARVKRLVGWKTIKRGLPKSIYTMEAYDCAHKEIFG